VPRSRSKSFRRKKKRRDLLSLLNLLTQGLKPPQKKQELAKLKVTEETANFQAKP
jgi:hypothetical protein